MNAERYKEIVKNHGIVKENQHGYLVAVGFESGVIMPALTPIGAYKKVKVESVAWVEIRPYDEPFVPRGHSPIPAFEEVVFVGGWGEDSAENDYGNYVR